MCNLWKSVYHDLQGESLEYVHVVVGTNLQKFKILHLTGNTAKLAYKFNFLKLQMSWLLDLLVTFVSAILHLLLFFLYKWRRNIVLNVIHVLLNNNICTSGEMKHFDETGMISNVSTFSNRCDQQVSKNCLIRHFKRAITPRQKGQQFQLQLQLLILVHGTRYHLHHNKCEVTQRGHIVSGYSCEPTLCQESTFNWWPWKHSTRVCRVLSWL